ncbi:MAG: serine hydrolase domain-containing protein [Polaromonas sp.]
MNTFVDDQVKTGSIHGAVTLIARNGQVAQLKAHGMMDVENKVPMRTDALFRAASITKIVAAVGALTLVDEGKMSLDDPVSRFLPEFAAPVVLTSQTRNPDGTWQTAPAQRAITIRDLLRHTAGLQYGLFGLNELDNEYVQFANAWRAPLSSFIRAIAALPLAYQPGTQFSYSYSIDVLGRVMELASGQPLDQFLAAKVFTPLQMVDTGFVVPAGKAARLSNFYQSAGGVLTLLEAGATSEFLTQPAGLSAGGGWSAGYGGIVTTATDYGRLLQMLLNKGQLEGTRILSAASVDEMIKDQLVGVDRSNRFPPLPVTYGLGVGVEERADAPGKPLILWAGGPYNTTLFADFKTGQYAILLTQTAPFIPQFRPGGIHSEFRAKALATVIP